jgi:hypothetical protein
MCTKVWQEKKIKILENIFLYIPQMYKALNTYKKESKKWWNR